EETMTLRPTANRLSDFTDTTDQVFSERPRKCRLVVAALNAAQANRLIRMDTIVFPGQSERLQVVPIPNASVLRREIAGFNDVRPPLPGILGSDLCRPPFFQRKSLCYIDELLDADAIRDDDRPDSDFGWAPGEVNFDFIL